MKSDTIIITEKDLIRLKNIIKNKSESEIENLEVELDRAKVVDCDQIPHGVVTMNSKVEYMDLTDNSTKIVTLVFPEEANTAEGKLSILAPVGSALT